MDLDDAFKEAAARLAVGPVSAQFYPYSELRHTWITNGHAIAFKVSDYLDGAPDEVMESLARYLVSKAFGRECGDGCAAYLAYSTSEGLWDSVKDRYVQRAKNLSFDVKGHARDLRAVFDYVNSFYFAGRAPEPILAWVRESPRRRLGYYFEPLRLLAANRVLDQDTVPRYVLEFVMYHELLHHLRGGDGRPVRRVHHNKEFKVQERAFSHYEEAEGWLRKIVSKRLR